MTDKCCKNCVYYHIRQRNNPVFRTRSAYPQKGVYGDWMFDIKYCRKLPQPVETEDDRYCGEFKAKDEEQK